MSIRALSNELVPGESVCSIRAHVNFYRQQQTESGHPIQCGHNNSPPPTPSETHAAQLVKKHLDKFTGPMKGNVFDSVFNVCMPARLDLDSGITAK